MVRIAKILWAVQKQKQQIEQKLTDLMIAQAAFDKTLSDLTLAVSAVITRSAVIPAPSTPDTAVQALLDGVAAQTSALTASLNAQPQPQ